MESATSPVPGATARLGDEVDRERLRALGDVLRELGAELNDEWTAFVGSQDIGHWELMIGDERLVVETETYEGITISGETELVNQVAQSVEQRLQK